MEGQRSSPEEVEEIRGDRGGEETEEENTEREGKR